MTAGGLAEFEVEDRAWALLRDSGKASAARAFVTAGEVSPEAQVAMQAALQRHVDGAISKTVLLPPDYDANRLGRLLLRAHRAGVKGVTVHRPGQPRGDVILPGCAGGAARGSTCEPG